MAGTSIVDRIRLGESATDSHNFLLKTNNDGTLVLSRGAAGNLGDILSVDAAGLVTLTQGRQLQIGTSQVTTTGTSIDFLSIPSWVKRITIALTGTSTNGSSNYQLQIGSSSFDTTGYFSTCLDSSSANSASGFLLTASVATGNTRSGSITMTHAGNNMWVMSGVYSRTDSSAIGVCSGHKTLSGVLDRIRLTTVNGADLFDAGSANIIYEG